MALSICKISFVYIFSVAAMLGVWVDGGTTQYICIKFCGANETYCASQGMVDSMCPGAPITSGKTFSAEELILKKCSNKGMYYTCPNSEFPDCTLDKASCSQNSAGTYDACPPKSISTTTCTSGSDCSQGGTLTFFCTGDDNVFFVQSSEKQKDSKCNITACNLQPSGSGRCLTSTTCNLGTYGTKSGNVCFCSKPK